MKLNIYKFITSLITRARLVGENLLAKQYLTKQ
jgi:hypothetical protein